MNKKTLVLIIAGILLLVIAACAGEPEVITVVETVTVIETVEVEVEVEGETVTVVETVEVIQEVEKEVVVTVEVEVEVEAVDEALAERQRTAIFDIDTGPVVDPELWNPFTPGTPQDHGLIQAMAEPLFILNLESAEGEIIPWLAESMTANDDATVWTITLRDGIQWSDGEALDADDLIFTIELAQNNPDLIGPRLPSFDTLSDINKVDDLTVELTLPESDFRFMQSNFVVNTGSSLTIVPEHIWAEQDPLTFTNYDPDQGWPVFTGPYLLESVSETEFSFTRDDNWWGVAAGFEDLPAPEKLIWRAFGTEETRTAATAKNELDSLMNVKLGSYLALQQLNPNIIAWTQELPYSWVDPCARNFHFNHTVAPWDDPEMRQAISLAIDHTQIIDINYEGTSTASRHWLPAFAAFNSYVDAAADSGLYDSNPVLTHDPEQAVAIIESKGWAINEETGYYEQDGEEFTMTITSFDDSEMNGIAALIVEQLQAIGINAIHDIQPIPEFIGNLTGAGFDTYIFFICGPVDLWAKMDSFSTRHIPAEGEESSGFYANTQRWNTDNAEAYSELVAQMRDLPPDSPELEGLFIEAMELWLSETPAVPISQAIKLVPFDETYWTGWPTADDPYIQPATWWQSAHVIIHNLEPVQ